jgi:ribonuclease HII
MRDALRVGIDENGLGPRLGPLVVTGIVARVTDDGAKIARRKPQGALAKRLGDSKVMVSHGDVALGEAWARALGRRLGLESDSPDVLLHQLMTDPRDELRRPCPSHVEAQCWNTAAEAYQAEGNLVNTVVTDLDKLAVKGLDVVGVRTRVVCTKRLNEARDIGRSRFDVDLHSMEQMILDVRQKWSNELDVICGKVGGYARYSGAFGPLAGRLHAIVEEGAKRSEYRFPGLGHIAFVRDADETDLLVAMASMVGKWVRELLMGRIVRFYGLSNDLGLAASGYHDPVTEKFVQATALSRRRRAIPDACFERRPLAFDEN